MYLPVDLGTVGADQHSLPWKINESSRVSGSSFHIPQNVAWPDRIHPFLWTPDLFSFLAPLLSGSMQDLGGLGGLWAFGDAVNDASPLQVVGRAQRADGEWHASLWTEGVGTRDLSRQPAEGWGLNDDGVAVGNLLGQADRAFLWDKNGGGTDLAAQFNIPQWSQARDINNSGAIVGFRGPGFTAVERGFVIESGAISYLPTLGGATSSASAINERGDVVGWADTAAGALHACLWRSGARSQPIDLGTLGGPRSVAYDLTEQGEIVGAAEVAPGSFRAALWHNGKIVDLNTQIPASSGWILTGAQSINNAGHIVCAGGRGAGEHAVLLQRPSSDSRFKHVVGYVTQILFGVVTGGPGIVIRPGKGPQPEPPPNPIWLGLAPEMQDLHMALVVKELAGLFNDQAGAERLQRDALKVALDSVQRMLRELEKK